MNNPKLHLKSHFLFLQNAIYRLLLNFAKEPDSNSGLSHGSYRKTARTNKKRNGDGEAHLNLNRRNWQRLMGGAMLACVVLVSGSAFGGRISDIRGTKHNLSATADGTTYVPPYIPAVSGVVPTRTVKATTETQVCVFCHTPHGATLGLMPLWNRKLSNATYIPYSSSSLDANAIQGTLDQPGGSSKLCLSCHDGTLAIGSVNVLNGLGSVTQQQSITMTGVAGASGVMASGDGTTTGYTRNLGIDLTNDHPISVTYSKALADRDGELRAVDATTQKDTDTTGAIIGIRKSSYKPKAPLEPTGAGNAGQVQCSACHDPHIRETDATVGNQKFLTLNRFQAANAAPTVFDSTKDISCVACHDKNNGNGVWVYSAHANSLVATQTYTNDAATQREFPKVGDCAGCTDLPVWKASCLNCHDTHTVSGSRWLLREGTDNAASPKAGGNSAIEETCYQCHSSTSTNANNAITPLTNIMDIKYDFALTYHMPVTLADQQAGASSPNSPTYPTKEAHDIGGNFASGGSPQEWVDCSTSGNPTPNKCGADFVEARTKLGAGTDSPNPPTSGLTNRHAECTDCHNPHRVVKFNSFLGANGAGNLSGAGDATSTHKHTDTDNYTHTNIASGALRGTFGVEPVYGSATSFSDRPDTISYTVKRGDPGVSTSSAVSATWVTREYQICLKCHSNYGYDETSYVADASSGPTRPKLPTSSGNGLTPRSQSGGLYNLYYYTNQAQEFQAPPSHMGETSGVSPSNTSYPGGASAVYQTSPQTNHRSWHPVMDATGRTLAIRAASGVAFNLPWRNNGNAVGTQTMYCDDCHGSNVSSATSVIPDNADATRRAWGPHGSGNPFILKDAWNSSSSALCLKCHDANTYTLGVAAAAGGGATGFMTNLGDGHQLHVDKIGSSKCNWCHVAVPHGWKNKALLVNLNDIGPEAGQTAGTEVQILAASSAPNNGYNKAPYYMNARLKVKTFKASGQWTANDCGSRGTAPGTGNGEVGLRWMAASGVVPGADYTENCQTPP